MHVFITQQYSINGRLSRYGGLQLNPTNLCFNITTTGPAVAQSSAGVTNITEDSIYRIGCISKLYTMYLFVAEARESYS
jgi:hypothetical protein